MTDPSCFPEMLAYQRSIDYTEGYGDGRGGATMTQATNDDYRAGFRDGSAARDLLEAED